MTLMQTPARGASQYLESVRRSYATLVHVARTLEAARSHEGEGAYLRRLGATVAAFVDQIVWADRQIVLGEYQALDALAREDSQHGGILSASLRELRGESEDLRPLPEFLKVCLEYDRPNGTRLTGAAINALESLGLALMASDREIAEEEMTLLYEIIGAWREATA